MANDLYDNQKSLRVWECLALRTSQLAESSQAEYISTLREFCDILRIEFGSRAGAELLLRVTEREALIYRKAIENSPGMKPREVLAVQSADKSILTQADLLDFRASKATIAKKLTIMRSLFTALRDYGLKPQNPFQFVRIPKRNAERRRPNIALPGHKVLEMFEACAGNRDSNIQDRAMLAAFFGGGLRRSEVAKLTLADIKKTGGNITYLRLKKTKSQEEQLQPVPEWAAFLLESWAERRRCHGASDLDFLFCGAVKHRLRVGIDDRTLARRVKRIAKTVGINPALVSGHTARHTAITELLSQKESLIAVQQFARHKNINTTMKYNHGGKELEDNAALKLRY